MKTDIVQTAFVAISLVLLAALQDMLPSGAGGAKLPLIQVFALYVALADPARALRSPARFSSRIARSTVGRLAPNRRASASPLGKRSADSNFPASISCRSASSISRYLPVAVFMAMCYCCRAVGAASRAFSASASHCRAFDERGSAWQWG